MIIKDKNKYRVVSSKGKNLGVYTSREDAVKRLRQVEYFKNKKKFQDGGKVEDSELKDKFASMLKGEDLEMVVGIAELLMEVEDKENRMDMVEDVIEDFKKEEIEFDYSVFEKVVMGGEDEESKDESEEEEKAPLMVFLSK